MQFVIMDAHDSDATRLSLQCGYIYEHYAQATIGHSNQYMMYKLS